MPSRLPAIEPLEARIAPASAVGRALDLPDTATVDVSGTKLVGLGVATNYAAGGLGSFPTGSDNDFIVMSTGDATKAYAPRPSNYPHFGLDHGKRGAYDDQQHLKVTVPVVAGQTHLKFDFNFMSDEYPGTTNPYNDSFSVIATPNVGAAETLVQLKVNDNVFLAKSPANAIYAHQTGVITADYRIPVGATSVTFDFYISDRPAPLGTNSGDGTGDTAVAIDNFRFTSAPQTVWLNFEGTSISNLLGRGTTLQKSAFQPGDIRSAADRTTLINSIFNDVAAKFAPYEIDFTLTQPPGGEYMEMAIGGGDSDTVTLGTGADPALVRSVGLTTTLGNIPGYARVFGLADFDYGNKSLGNSGFINSAHFATTPIYAGESAATLQQRIEVTIAHEIGHSLGLPHLDDSFDNNIMAQFSPRSPAATFEDISRALSSGTTLPDGTTALNTHQYLEGVLGSSTNSVMVNGPNILLAHYILNLFFGVKLFDVAIGVTGDSADSETGADGPAQWFTFPEIDAGSNTLELPSFGANTRLYLYGSTVDGGPVDFFTGTPDAGDLAYGAGFVPLFDGDGQPVATLPAAQGTLGGGLTALNGGIGMSLSQFSIPNLQPVPAKTGFTFQDTDGDLVTVKLTSKTGTAAIQLNDPDNDGKGTIERIELQGTGAKDKLEIIVKKNKDTGDGFIDVGRIAGPTLGTLAAKNSNLTGEGIVFGGLVGSITVRDVENGADIIAGGTFETKTKLAARDIGDGTVIDVDGQLKLTALRIGEGSIEAALLGQLAVTGDSKLGIQGDFESNITIVPGKVLSDKEAKMNLLAGVSIAGRAIDVDIVVPGHVGAFKAGTFEHSSLLLGFTPNVVGDPFSGGVFAGDFKLTSFAATGIKNSPLPAFDDSVVIAAQLGGVTLASADTDNGGNLFGFAAKNGLAKNLATIVVKAPDFRYDKTLPLPQNSGDFTVKLI